TGPAGYPAAQFVDKDLLIAGRDLIYGEGLGSAPGLATAGVGNFDDIIFGDLGVITQDVSGPRDTTKAVPAKPQKISTTLLTANATSNGVLNVDSKALQNGADDTIYGNLDRDILVGGPGNDAIDGGEQDDRIFGDNVSMVRTLGDYTSPHFQTLAGTLRDSRSDEAPFPTAGASGQLLVDGTPRTYRGPDYRPWWSEYDVTNLWHDFAADPQEGSHWAGSFGNDYIAGNKGNDVILGELGNDVIQGDGSIDFISKATNQETGATAALGGCVGAFRTPGGPADPTGPLTVSASYEAATDGQDYIEGNGGDDVIFGGLD